MAEGFHLLEEALRSECRISSVLAAESVHKTVARHIKGLSSIRLIRVPDALFSETASTEATQGVIALVQPARWELDHLLRSPALVAVLDGIQDPGNAGAILRTAEAFGASGALFMKGTVSPYNPKAVRASAGSLFRLPLVYGMEEKLVCAALGQRSIEVYAAMPGSGTPAASADLRRNCAIVIGSEGRGVSQKLHGMALDVSIPMRQVESLNAAVAAGILFYEARRQRGAA